MTATPSMLPDPVAVQRRTIGTLVVAQAIGAVGITIGIATASLLARDISGSESQAGLAQTFQVLGAAVASFLLARLMSRRGRRVGLITGYLLGAVRLGARRRRRGRRLDAAAAGGRRTARLDDGGQQRCAVRRHRPRAGRAAGPGAVDRGLGDHHRRRRRPQPDRPLGRGRRPARHPRADRPVRPRQRRHARRGRWSIGVFLRPDPLLLARELADEPPATTSSTSWGRVVEAVRDRPVLAAAIAGLAGAHAAMVAVMVMTPLHMEHGGAELRVIGIVISVHVLGMFAFSPLVGLLADRAGRPPVLASGGLLLIVSLFLCHGAPEGSSWQIFAGLFLLGLGWSFATVAASTMITDDSPLDARTDVQGAADLIMGLTAAAAGGIAGVVVGRLGLPRARARWRWRWPGWSLFAAYVGGRHRTDVTVTPMTDPVADVAVIGGSGFYSFLDDPEQHPVETPYGAPSAPVSVGTVAGRRVAFLPRHGPGHEYPPHLINYRANLWALRSLGVRQVLAPCAVGGLLPEVAPGDVVVPDQLVDRTWGAASELRRDRRLPRAVRRPLLRPAVRRPSPPPTRT